MITQEEFQNAAITHYKQGNYVECIKICNHAINNNLQTGPIYNVKSLAALALKQYDEALNAIQEAVFVSPQNETYRKNKVKIETIVNRNKKESDFELPDEETDHFRNNVKKPQSLKTDKKREIPIRIIGGFLGTCVFFGLLFALSPIIFQNNTHIVQPADSPQTNPLGNPLETSDQGVSQSSGGNSQSFDTNSGPAGADSDIKISITSPSYRNYQGTQSILFELVATNSNPYDQTEIDAHPFLEGLEILYSLNEQPPVKFPRVEVEEYALDSNEVSITLPLPNQLLQAGDELFLIVKPKKAQGEVTRVTIDSQIYNEDPYPFELWTRQLGEGIDVTSGEEMLKKGEAIKQKLLQ